MIDDHRVLADAYRGIERAIELGLIRLSEFFVMRQFDDGRAGLLPALRAQIHSLIRDRNWGGNFSSTRRTSLGW